MSLEHKDLLHLTDGGLLKCQVELTKLKDCMLGQSLQFSLYFCFSLAINNFL